jgi:hypothetical protein
MSVDVRLQKCEPNASELSPSGATSEVENYSVSLRDATELELHIVAEVSDERRVATLTSLRLR